MRRVKITGGNLTLFDYCTAGPQYSSGGFIADSQTGRSSSTARSSSSSSGTAASAAGRTASGTRCSRASRARRDAVGFPEPAATRRSPTSPVTREKPFLYVDAPATDTACSCPALRTNSVGHDLGRGADRRARRSRSATSSSRKPTDDAQRDQQRARARAEPAAHAGRLPPRPDAQGQAAGHGRARPRLPDARPRQRRRRR